MPSRLLKEGICDSAKIDALSAEEEVFFYRLLVVADDFGRMDARPAILRARCFPLKETLSASKVESWLKSLNSVGLLARYEVDGKPFLQIGNWDQRQRSSSKYPPPNDEDAPSVVGQLAGSCQSSDRLGLGKGLGLGAANAVAFSAGAWTVPDSLRSTWESAYPAVDIDGELAKASAWLLANPKNAKSNYARFLNSWLTRAQDKAPRVPAQAPIQREVFT